MTAADHSQAERIDSWTRAIAEEHARQAGMSLREWLTRIVTLEAADCNDEQPDGWTVASSPMELETADLAEPVDLPDAIAESVAPRMEGLERVLRQVCDYIEASEQSAQEAADARAKVALILEGLAERVDDFERRGAQAAAESEQRRLLSAITTAIEPSEDLHWADNVELDAAVLEGDWPEAMLGEAEDQADWPVMALGAMTEEPDVEATSAGTDADSVPDASDMRDAGHGPSSRHRRNRLLPPRSERPRRASRRASVFRTAVMVVGGGAGLGVAAAACLLVLSGSPGALAGRQMVAANGASAKAAPSRDREAAAAFMALIISPKPTR